MSREQLPTTDRKQVTLIFKCSQIVASDEFGPLGLVAFGRGGGLLFEQGLDSLEFAGCQLLVLLCESDQGVDPGRVIPAPSVNNGMNPLPADHLPQSPSPISDPPSPPGQGRVQCSGQQPNPCIYTPASGPPGTAVYSPGSGEVVGPDGVKYNVSNSSNPGDDEWKEMLAPAS